MTENMNKTNIIVFASICAISFCYILFFDKSKSRRKKKLDREIAETIKNLNNDNNALLIGNDSTKK